MKKALQRFTMPCLLIVVLLLASSCTRHIVESRSQVELAPVEVKPIHITIDVNIKVDRALNDYFGEIDKAKEEIYDNKMEDRAAGLAR
jgi:hypothetical protein